MAKINRSDLRVALGRRRLEWSRHHEELERILREILPYLGENARFDLQWLSKRMLDSLKLDTEVHAHLVDEVFPQG